MFDTLLHVDPNTAQLRPGLAESWSYSNDGKKVIFQLPAGLKWSDGKLLTAAAIVASLKVTEHPALLAFSQIAAPDAATLELTFAKIDCAAVTTLAQLPLLPADAIQEPLPTGSGPFKIGEWSENKRTLSLTRNRYYAGPAPLLDGLTIRFIAEDEAAVALSEGQFDALGPISASPLHVPDLADLVYPAPQMVYVAINFAPKNTEAIAPEVRKALLLALDRPAILAEALAGDGQLLAGSLLPGHWAAKTDLPQPAYDVKTARSLLRKAGLRDEDGDGWLDREGKRLELYVRTRGDKVLMQNLAWLVSSYYRDLDLLVRADTMSFTDTVDRLFKHDFDMAVFSWPLTPDPDQRLFWRSSENTEGQGLNFTSYDNPTLDKLLDRAVAVPGCDTGRRAKLYGEIQETLTVERPIDFLFVPNRHVLVGTRLHGLKPGPFAPFTWNVSEWYVQGKE